MINILLFAGTYEGRIIGEYCENITQINLYISTATEYGNEIISHLTNAKLYNGRMDVEQIVDIITNKNINIIIDATHPYATVVSENIIKAVRFTEIEYLRVIREETSLNNDNIIIVESIQQAIEILNEYQQGNILITTGSKEIDKYKNINNINRLYPRVLPMVKSINDCINAGIKSKNIIAMQGPFSENLNIALLKEFNIRFLVTKDTGDVGGYFQKANACKKTNTTMIIIKRPLNEVGKNLNKTLEYLDRFKNNG